MTDDRSSSSDIDTTPWGDDIGWADSTVTQMILVQTGDLCGIDACTTDIVERRRPIAIEMRALFEKMRKHREAARQDPQGPGVARHRRVLAKASWWPA